jgi:hypothetical protein
MRIRAIDVIANSHAHEDESMPPLKPYRNIEISAESCIVCGDGGK